MARLPKTPRLRDVDPELIARHVVTRAASQLVDFARRMGLSISGDARGETPLSRAIIGAATYARTGLGADRADEHVSLIEETLLHRLVDDDGEVIAAKDDWKTPLGLVLAAAHGRLNVAAGKPLRANELAALSGLSVERIRQEIRMGRMKRAATPPDGRRPIDALILASTARQWLIRRRVPGFVE